MSHTNLDKKELATKKMVDGFNLILEGLGLDLTSEHLVGTPERAARAWREELCLGLTQPEPKISLFTTNVDEMVVLRHIPIRSLCAHHLLPFIGEATVAYVPGTGKLIGISKLSRIADYWARRPQIQELLTAQIADHVAGLVVDEDPDWERLGWHKKSRKQGPRGGVGVVIHARHLCMEVRGVGHVGDMVTSSLRGVFLTKPEARAEFLQLIRTEDSRI